MIKKTILLLLLSLVSLPGFAKSAFKSQIRPIPPYVQTLMKKQSWHRGCPVPLKDLSVLSLTYWGYDHKTHMGTLVVNAKIAQEVVDIFREIYQHHFPIDRMQSMDFYGADDYAAMSYDDTAAFNCRDITGHPGIFSWHSYGAAIDINTLVNPYVRGRYIIPAAGRKYVNRHRKVNGMIHKGDVVYSAFVKRGWVWGGDWHTPKDYQHFEKRMV